MSIKQKLRYGYNSSNVTYIIVYNYESMHLIKKPNEEKLKTTFQIIKYIILCVFNSNNIFNSIKMVNI